MTRKLQSVKCEESQVSAEQLEAILFRFMNLYEGWSESRQAAARQGADIARFVKEFSSQVERFESIEEFVRAQIRLSMKDATMLAMSSVKDAVADAIYEETSKAANDIQKAVGKAGELLKSYQSSLNTTHWKMTGAMILSSIVTSLLVTYLLAPGLISLW